MALDVGEGVTWENGQDDKRVKGQKRIGGDRDKGATRTNGGNYPVNNAVTWVKIQVRGRVKCAVE